MRIIFLGTPDFSVATLQELINSHHEVIAVVCQPDRPSGRGNKVIPGPVKKTAIANDIPVFQFEKIGRDGVDTLKKLKPDIMITVAYGQILTQQIIDIPKYGIINVHASLLPKYRGASPIQTALLMGETVTGITIMQTDIGLDTGDILSMQEVNIDPDDTAETLGRKLSAVGSKLLLRTLDEIAAGTVVRIKQNNSEATFTKKIKKHDCVINWNKSARQIKCLIMGANPDPIAYSMINGQILKIYTAQDLKLDLEGDYEVGEILPNSSVKNGVFVRCGSGVIKLGFVQLPGGKTMDAALLLNGRKLNVGDKFDFVVHLEG